jgi:hypothetical protein
MMKSIFLLSLLTPLTSTADGRLFYTQAERSGLEHARQHHITEHIATAPGTAEQPLTFNGVVMRSDGKNTRWVNGQPLSGGTIHFQTRGKMLKPGQTLYGNKVYEAHGIVHQDSGETHD